MNESTTGKAKIPARFDAAAKLLQTLVPRARAFLLFDADRNCLWASAGSDDYEVEACLGEIPDEILQQLNDAPLRRALPTGRVVLLLPFNIPRRRPATFAVVFSRNAGASSSFSPATVHDILRPALDLLARAATDADADQQQDAVAIERELKFVYEIDERIHGATARHSSLAQLVGRSGRFLGINYSVLLIPAKRIRISATHSSWKSVNRRVLDRYLIDHLLPKLDGRSYPMVFEIPADAESDMRVSGYQALLCPITDGAGNVEGVLALLGRVDGSSFGRNDRRVMAHVGRKVEYVIEQSFDPMTGLMNRAGFEAQLKESYQSLASATDAHQVVYFDLDSLQLVNDTFGDKAGDAVIVRFAQLLEEALPRTGVLSRLSGDDFCLLLTAASTDDALAFASDVRQRLGALRYLEGDRSLQLTMSVGIAGFTREHEDVGAVLTTARMACESAKAHGRDRIEVYDDDNRSLIRRFDDMQLVASIQQALDEGGFELLAQPISGLGKHAGELRHEILVRMPDGEGGYIPTDAFLSAAERYKMMPQVDRWVISQAVAALSAVAGATTGSFCINLSGQSLGDDELLEFIREEIEANGIAAEALGFEITESAAVSNLKKAQQFIDALSALGCSISLDDFGAGLSSFAYLKTFKVDVLKIDGSFIRDLDENRISESMVAAITEVARVMQLCTVAEYVETEALKDRVEALGVDYAQGHFIGRPIALAELLASAAPVQSSTG